MVNFSRDVALTDLTELYLRHPVVATGKLTRPIPQCCKIHRFLWRIADEMSKMRSVRDERMDQSMLAFFCFVS